MHHTTKRTLPTLLACLWAIAALLFAVQSAFAETDASTAGYPIRYENGIHYIDDPAYPDEPIVLYCMNSQLHWPHVQPDMPEGQQIPGYIEGYLTPDMFKEPQQQNYDECILRLKKLLYAGYPYNGEGLYRIVDDSTDYVPTEEEFNKMLRPSAVLGRRFPRWAGMSTPCPIISMRKTATSPSSRSLCVRLPLSALAA